MHTRLAALLLLALAGCDAGRASLRVEVASDLVPGVEVTALRVELAEDEAFEGRLDAETTALGPDAALAEGVLGGDFALAAAGVRFVRVSLLDAAGRLRAQRVAALAVRGPRTVSLALERACAARLCPMDGDADDAFACHGGACVPESCTGEDPAACDGAPVCVTDGDCASDASCRDAVCRAGACLLVDACGPGAVCDGRACRPAPACGDGSCDPGVETACGCTADCGACPAACGDGVCGAGEAACPEDCGPPEPTCGNGLCEVEAETDESCPEDCHAATPPAVCGDDRCEGAERCVDCPECCEARGCGDGTCDAAESACGCPADCGPCGWCGDGRCEPGEACDDDCAEGAPVCGDGACAAEESCALCPGDCGWCVGVPAAPPDHTCVGATEAPASETCDGLPGAFTRAAVNVGFYPMRVIAEGDGAPLVTGDVDDEGARGVVLLTLPPGARFAAQSVRNPACSEAPPLRPARDGWLFGYAIDAVDPNAREGWVRAVDLELDDAGGGACAYGPRGADFALRVDPYAATDACRPLHCDADDFFRACRDANPAGEDAADCGRARDEERAVGDAPILLYFAPDDAARTYLHPGDRLRVLHESGRAGWLFVETLTTGAPHTAPAGSRGWVNEAGLR